MAEEELRIFIQREKIRTMKKDLRALGEKETQKKKEEILEIREKRGLAYAIRSSLETEKHYSYYTIYVGTAKESIPEVRSLIIEGFKNIDKMSQEDLKEAKERLIGLKKVSSEESVNVMNELMFLELTTKAENYYTYEEDINKVTLEEVKSLAKKMIKKYSTAAIVPK